MFKRLKRNEEGQVLIGTTILLLVIIGFTALVVDVGYFYAEKRQLQNAVDAAALSGVIVADETNRDKVKVDQEVDKYLLANLEKETPNRIIKISETEPITVTVDLTTDYPTFFGKIFQISSVDIYAHAKAIVHKYEFEPTPNAIMAETGNITFNGSDFNIDGPIYSHDPIKGKLDKITIEDTDPTHPDYPRSKEDLIDTATEGVQTLPDYSGLLNLPSRKMSADDFESEYIGTGKELTGIVHVTGNGGISINNATLVGKGVLYVEGNIVFRGLTSSSDSSILYYSGQNIDVQDIEFYGVLYAPNGSVTFRGDPNNSGSGAILARDNVTFNGAKFEGSQSADDWMEGVAGGSQLIE